jgi:beta-glucanase (GH16 family)
VVLPGRIEAVNFDKGGDGVGYHDIDSENLGGAYRPTDAVDIQPCSGCGTSGLDVGWVRPGEWLAYTVTFRFPGSYTISSRVASDGPGGTFHFELDGVRITDTITVPSSGGWQKWTSVSAVADVKETSTALLRVVMDTGGAIGAIGNLASFTFVPNDGSPSGGGPLVFSDDFETLNTDVWKHEVTANGGGNGEFQYYSASSNNSYVRDGVLYIVPTLTSDRLGVAAVEGGYTLDLRPDGCQADGWSACVRTSGNGQVLPPAQSARINSRGTVSCQYCHVQIRARLPLGDWLWPALWMLPRDLVYGGWPASGEIDIMETRGNGLDYPGGGVGSFHATLHWGPRWPADPYYLTTGGYKLKSGALSDDFHIYGLKWSPTGLQVYLDNETNTVLNVKFDQPFYNRGGFGSQGLNNPWRGRSNAAPFDQEFYVIFNLAVGGTNGYFPDGYGKPWANADGQFTGSTKFWKARDKWYPTWKGEAAALAIDWIRIYDL